MEARAVPLDAITRVLVLSAGPPVADPVIRDLCAGPRFEWPGLLERAERQGITGALWRRLRRIGVAPADDAGTAAWQRAALRADHRTLLAGVAGDAVLEVLAGAGLRPVVLKGGALARAVYSHRADRPMLDLDVLLPREVLPEARRRCEEAGWVPALQAGDEEARTFFGAHQHEVPLRDPRTGAQLELHSELFFEGHPFAPLAADRVLTRAVFGAAGLAPGVGMPSDDDLLLHLALHFAWSHVMSSGFWRACADLSALVAAGRIDWDAVPSRAREARAETALFWTLHLAGELAMVPVPAPVLRALRAGFVPDALVGPLTRHFAWHCTGAPGSCPSVALARGLWRAGLRPARSRHGGALPWQREHLFPGYDTVPTPTTVGERWRHAREQVPRFIRYAAALLR